MRLKRCWPVLVTLTCGLLTGCATSVEVLSPVAPTGSARLLAVERNPIPVTLRFHPRAVISTLRVTLQFPAPVRPTPPPGGSCAYPIDVVPLLTPPPVAGGTSTATITIPPEACFGLTAANPTEVELAVAADMSPSKAFDTTGYTRPFRILEAQGGPPPPMTPPPPAASLAFSPAGPLTVNAGMTAMVSVTATPAPVNATTITLRSNSANANVPASTTIVANNTTSAPFAITGVTAGNATITATAAGLTSGSINVTVRPAPVVSTLLFRTSGNDVQTFEFAAGRFTLLDTDPATPQGGTAVVSLAFNGRGHVVRTSAADVQSFAVVNNALNVAGAAAPGRPSGTGASVAAAGDIVVRALDAGLETYRLVNGVPARQTPQPIAGTVSATGVAVDLAGSLAARAHSAGIDIYEITNIGAPVLVGSASSTGGQISSVGVGVALAPNGALAVRSGPAGIDVFPLGPGGRLSPARSATNGVPSLAINTAVALDAAAARAVRAHSAGIEVYDISNPAAPQRIGQATGSPSTTGVAVIVRGTTAFRATNSRIEAYDISNPATIPNPISIAATPSFIGVGLAGR